VNKYRTLRIEQGINAATKKIKKKRMKEISEEHKRSYINKKRQQRKNKK